MTNSVEPGVLAEPGVELAEMRRAVRLILDDHPDDLGIVAEQQMADRADQRRAACRSGARRWSPWRRRRRAPASAHASGRRPARSAIRSAGRAPTPVGDVDEEAVGDEGRIDRADRIVGAAQLERRREAAVLQLLLEPLHGDAVDRHLASWPSDAVQHRRARSSLRSARATGLAFVVCVVRRHRRQQAAQIGIVPGFDAPGRQAGLQHLDRRCRASPSPRHRRAAATAARRTRRSAPFRRAFSWVWRGCSCMFTAVTYAASPMTPA